MDWDKLEVELEGLSEVQLGAIEVVGVAGF